jgi:hypothetical protein
VPTPKSKASKRKMRRWQYDVLATKDGQTQRFHSPAMTIGTSRIARETATKIAQDLSTLPQFDGALVTVKPAGCETVSQTVIAQINGLSDENKMLVRTIKDLVSDRIKADPNESFETPFDDQVKEAMGKAVMNARMTMMIEQQAAAAKAAAALGGEAILAGTVPEGFTPPDAPAEPNAPGLDVELDLTDPKVTDALEVAFDQAAARAAQAARVTADASPDAGQV